MQDLDLQLFCQYNSRYEVYKEFQVLKELPGLNKMSWMAAEQTLWITAVYLSAQRSLFVKHVLTKNLHYAS